MATSSRKRIRYSFDIHFCSLEEKDRFLLKLKVARKKLTQEGSPLLDNYILFSTLLDKEVADLMPPHSVMKNSGKYCSLFRTGQLCLSY